MLTMKGVISYEKLRARKIPLDCSADGCTDRCTRVKTTFCMRCYALVFAGNAVSVDNCLVRRCSKCSYEGPDELFSGIRGKDTKCCASCLKKRNEVKLKPIHSSGAGAAGHYRNIMFPSDRGIDCLGQPHLFLGIEKDGTTKSGINAAIPGTLYQILVSSQSLSLAHQEKVPFPTASALETQLTGRTSIPGNSSSGSVQSECKLSSLSEEGNGNWQHPSSPGATSKCDTLSGDEIASLCTITSGASDVSMGPLQSAQRLSRKRSGSTSSDQPFESYPGEHRRKIAFTDKARDNDLSIHLCLQSQATIPLSKTSLTDRSSLCAPFAQTLVPTGLLGESLFPQNQLFGASKSYTEALVRTEDDASLQKVAISAFPLHEHTMDQKSCLTSALMSSFVPLATGSSTLSHFAWNNAPKAYDYYCPASKSLCVNNDDASITAEFPEILATDSSLFCEDLNDAFVDSIMSAHSQYDREHCCPTASLTDVGNYAFTSNLQSSTFDAVCCEAYGNGSDSISVVNGKLMVERDLLPNYSPAEALPSFSGAGYDSQFTDNCPSSSELDFLSPSFEDILHLLGGVW